MNPVLLVWLQFLFCLAVIGVAGTRLSRYGDAIADLTGLSRGWIGLILLATVTSLPELVTGLSAVILAEAPDIAVGDALGSCVFNLGLIALADLFYRKEPLYSRLGSNHLVSAGFGVILLASAALAVLLTAQGALPSIGHVSLASPMLLALYLVAMRALYVTEQRALAGAAAEASAPTMSLKTAATGYTLASAVIVGAGVWLPLVGVELARTMQWSDSFVGTLFVAFATSVPELATTWGALRIGALDMALGNLLGSNLFDVLILALDDFAYLAGPIYRETSVLHAVTALAACLMSGTVIVGLAYRPVGRVWHLVGWVSIALLALYLLNAAIMFLHGPRP